LDKEVKAALQHRNKYRDRCAYLDALVELSHHVPSQIVVVQYRPLKFL